ncbi:MAG TPA: zinc ribbon domain-containing protein [Vicinamibacterales bacterium]|jgi:hypothetical protein
MICQHCGTEIADKALVCYRCGHATSEPLARPGQAPKPGSRIPVIAALLVLILGALFMSQAAVGEAPHLVSWVVAGLAVIVLVWRFWRGRR